jgi:predicted  nucleic acid-binding Zn-ribbon protein
MATSMKHHYLKTPVTYIVIGVIASLMLLTSCGGGSGGGSTTPVANSPAPSANTEIINGIPVPPEPDPVVNNATLAGVDEDKNGVRDDVQRVIAEKSKSQNEYMETIEIQKTTGKLFTNFDQVNLRNEMIQSACKLSRISLPTYAMNATLNSKERELAYRKGIGKIGGFLIDATTCGGGSDDL